MVIAGKAKSKSKKKRRALCIGRAFKGGTGNNKKGKKARRIAPSLNQLEPVSNWNKLPNACNKKHAAQLGAMRISDHDHEVIMEEARRRDLLEHDELEQLEEDEEAESEVEADSDMDGAGDSEPESE